MDFNVLKRMGRLAARERILLFGVPASTASISQLQNLYSWFLLDSFLGGVLEGADQWGHVVFVVVSRLLAWLLGEVAHHALESLVLLGANLLDDIGEHVLELLGLRGAGHDQQVLAHGELNYTQTGSEHAQRLRTLQTATGL
jgi:hypothetical protein